MRSSGWTARSGWRPDEHGGEPEDDVLHVEEQDGVLIITLNRPQARNALDAALSSALVEAVAQLNDRPDLHAGVLTGAGGLFCSGMDLKAFSSSGPPKALASCCVTAARPSHSSPQSKDMH